MKTILRYAGGKTRAIKQITPFNNSLSTILHHQIVFFFPDLADAAFLNNLELIMAIFLKKKNKK